jgi:glycosyltransferase involved in cell wall biosynthesis
MIPPKITVITPTLNTGLSIETVLLSVANQTYASIEHLIIDGDSKDKTLPAIRKYQEKYKNIRLLTEKDSGIYNAMNKGLDLCTGDWIIFMGADDAFYDENVLQDLFEEGLFQEEQIIYGNVSVVGDTFWAKDGRIYDGPFELKKLLRTNICHQGILYPRSVIKQIGHYSEKYPISADWDYNLRCYKEYKFTYTEKIIAYFKSGGVSMNGDDTLSKDFLNNIISYFHLDPYSNSVYDQDSPFYFLMAGYRETKAQNHILYLQEEAERLKQQITYQQTNNLESLTVMEEKHERSMNAMRAEFDETMTQFRSEQNNLLAVLRSENETTIRNLIEEHNQVVFGLKEEFQSALTNLKTDQDNLLMNLRTAFNQESSNLKIEHANLISDLRGEHKQEIHILKAENDNLVSNLRMEHKQEIHILKAENDRYVTNLNSSHAEFTNTLKNGYEETIKTLQTEHLTFLELFRQKENEFLHVIESNNQHISHLNLTITGNEILFRETVEKFQQEIRKLKEELNIQNDQIATMYSSYTWKVGKVLLSPAVFIAKKLNKEKH